MLNTKNESPLNICKFLSIALVLMMCDQKVLTLRYESQKHFLNQCHLYSTHLVVVELKFNWYSGNLSYVSNNHVKMFLCQSWHVAILIQLITKDSDIIQQHCIFCNLTSSATVVSTFISLKIFSQLFLKCSHDSYFIACVTDIHWWLGSCKK